ncbi:uncharacterized protein FPRO_05753 [Fusarium proliferatum ET1]|uniref:Uncharacterized protein n=1 Tax=Fusarium proliferatum (strain ET1) TaxID=1227346 RepID=A0A1L7VHS8_FUSPR|nr:uncharacterized protein FPRO_05753 [Fusarium proliferatum ET1]CZR39055.1 uncharacterized protein FPRO_05753 [Fusarium proliferatum ET1]
MDANTVTVSRFVWEVAKVFWNLWFLGLNSKSKPIWPWPQPPSEKNGEKPSTVFASLREDHLRDGKLGIYRVSIPEEAEYQAAQPQNESTSTKAMVCDNMHNPLPIAPPSLNSRRIAWEALYPGATPSERDRPFTLILRPEFDFWTFVYGPDGRDFNKIRERLMEEQPPEKGHAIVVWPASLQGADGSELSSEVCKLINLEGISRIWHDILGWYDDFTKTRVTTLRSHLEDLSETRKVRTIQGAAKLPGGFKDVLSEIKKERDACKAVINGFLDRKSPDLTTIVFISNWAIKGKEGHWVGVPERINLAGDLWRGRAETPEEKLEISELVLEIKERAKSDLLRV